MKIQHKTVYGRAFRVTVFAIMEGSRVRQNDQKFKGLD